MQPDIRQSVGAFVARVHKKVNEVSQTYLTNERRYNYTTPKSFLEQIKLYKVRYDTIRYIYSRWKADEEPA